MFEFVRTHTKLMQLLLLVLILPSFAFFGVQGYHSFFEGKAASVASVGGADITQGEWDTAQRNQMERARAQMPGLDPKFFDSPAMRQQVLESLVRERLLLHAAYRLHLEPTQDRVNRYFDTDPQYASLRNLDTDQLKSWLGTQGLSAERFNQLLMQELASRQVTGPITASAIAPAEAASAAIGALFQQREVQLARFEPKDFAATVAVTDAEIQAMYDDPAQAGIYTAPESVSVEYAVLDLAAIERNLKVDDTELKKFYEANQARFKSPEERRVRHILVRAPKSASSDEKARAKAKAQALLEQLQKDRSQFAALARKESQDPGSAAQGGELEYFSRGVMAPQFDAAMFALKKGELSGLVETDSGFHIIELLDARGGDQRPFDAVKAEIQDEVRRRQAQAKYAESADTFVNTVESQDDGLSAVAGKLNLEVQRSERVMRTPMPGAQGALANAKFLEALFKPESLEQKRTTAPIDIGSNQMAAGRVLTHAPARKLPLAEVREALKSVLVARKSAEAARAQGQARLQAWRQAPETASLQPPQKLSRAQQSEPRALIDALLREPADKLPAWVGVDLGAQGYVVAKLLKVAPPDPALLGADPQRIRNQYAQSWGQAEELAYQSVLRERYKVKITGKAKATDPLEEPVPAPR